MGLDMYLIKKLYIGEEYEHRNIKTKVKVIVKDKVINITEKIQNISIAVGYWRKANQIHAWFVKNVQGGEDDCKEYMVGAEQLEELGMICKKVLDDHSLAVELLPSEEGFFFGTTDYGEYYYECLEATVEIVSKVLASIEKDTANGLCPDIYYQSSW